MQTLSARALAGQGACSSKAGPQITSRANKYLALTGSVRRGALAECWRRAEDASASGRRSGRCLGVLPSALPFSRAWGSLDRARAPAPPFRDTRARAGLKGSSLSSKGTITAPCGGDSLNSPGRVALVAVAALYATLIVVLPFGSIFVQAVAGGLGSIARAMAEPEFLHATKMTMTMALIAVPVNTAFGVLAALVLAGRRFAGRRLLLAAMDIPFSISPVVTGLMFVLLYGRTGLFAPLIARSGFQVVFALPGMALATMFVTLPFVVRELLPALEEKEGHEEEAAASLGAGRWRTFWEVTLPNVRWALLYGVILTNARAMGE
ncbi:hypothetical protein H632_c2103p1, partial [Helicosporidium sp. ATCC 50920]